MKLWILLYAVFPLLVSTEDIKSHLRRLQNDIFGPYSTLTKPTVAFDDAVKVTFDAVPRQLLEINSWSQKITMMISERQTWRDEFLQWNPSDYGNITHIYVPPHKVWLPDVIFYDTPRKTTETDRAQRSLIKILLYSTGLMISFEPSIKTFPCPMDITFFPYDIQKCRLTVGTWNMDYSQLDLVETTNIISNVGFISHHEWSYIGAFVERTNSCYVLEGNDETGSTLCNPSLQFQFTFERKPEFYEKNLVLPSAMIIFLGLMVFLLPNDCKEKMKFGMSVFLALCVNLRIVTNFLPSASESYPVIGTYFLTCIVLITFSILQTTFVMSLHFRYTNTDDVPIMPPSIRYLFFNILGKLVFFQYSQPIEDPTFYFIIKNDFLQVKRKLNKLPDNLKRLSNHMEAILDTFNAEFGTINTETANIEDWLNLATVLDRISAVLYFLATSICLGYYVLWFLSMYYGSIHNHLASHQ